MNRAEYLLNCSITYKNSKLRDRKVPDTFQSEYEAKKVMLDVLLHEAKESLEKNIIQPETLSYCPIDLDTEKPGIYKEEKEVIRKSAPFPKIHYSINPKSVNKEKYESSTQEVETKPKKYPKTVESAHEKTLKDSSKHLEKQERRACREFEKELEKEEKKRLLAEETPEQREERLKEQREKRKRKKEENKDKPPKEKKEKKTTPKDEIDEMEPAYDEILPPPPKRVSSKIQFYECPIPHDRHMYALERCELNDELSKVLLNNIHDEDTVKIIQGPPGTGKTNSLLDIIKNKSGRILCCATTNVGAADLYNRCVRMGIKDCSLILPPDRIPKDTILMSEDPTQRIVCCTVSGRNGKHLHDQEFETILLDEAGQCMEACVWGLLRHCVNFFCMAGDIYQLPSQTSESGKELKHDRSLMQRLIENGYPFTELKIQRRMHPEISSFPNKFFYGGKLKNQGTLENSDEQPYKIVNIKGTVSQDKTSYLNKDEADKCIKIYNELSKKYKNIVIITPYTSQCKVLLSYKTGVPIHTIDSFQGKECDCVILSMVRSGSDIGFWSDPRRLTVALTRAKNKLVVVGDAESWKSSPLVEMTKDAKERNLYF